MSVRKVTFKCPKKAVKYKDCKYCNKLVCSSLEAIRIINTTEFGDTITITVKKGAKNGRQWAE
jgi:hypothetical protein